MATERTAAGGQARTDAGPFALLETVVSPMFVHQGGQVLFANAAMERLTGRSRSELAAVPYCEVAHDDDRPALRAFCEARLRGDAGPNSHEFRVAAKDGETRYVEVRVSRTRLQGQAALIGSIYDFTERQRAEAAQRSMRRLLRQIIDGDPVPTFVIGADHKLTHWNRACAAITGVAASDIVGTDRQWAPFYPAERPVLADLIVSGAVEEQFAAHYQDKLRRSTLIDGAFEGEDFFPHFGEGGSWLYFTAAPLRDEAGGMVGAIETLQDVTARHQAESELRRYQLHLEQLVEQRTAQLEQASRQLVQSEKLASLGQLAAGVAHEINNPIGFVLSNIGSLENYVGKLMAILEAYAAAEPSISAPEQLAKIRKACQDGDVDFLKEDIPLLIAETRDGIHRVKRIVQDLKEFSHVDLAHDWQWTDLHRCLDSTINIVNNEVKYRADLIKDFGQLPEVECLPWQLNQVFMNLVVNATHAMSDKRGTITVRTRTVGEEVWLEFSDNGCGIPEEIRSKVFDPFFTTKPVGKGTGLGLSLSYGIIRNHGGRIELESEVGKGTTFRVILPIKHVEKTQDQAANSN